MNSATSAWEIVGDSPSKLLPGTIDLETHLEGWLAQDPQMVEPGLHLLARQLSLVGGTVDLLCLDRNGRLVVIEIKRGDATRDALAQALDYSACLATMDANDLKDAIDSNRTNSGLVGSLAQALEATLGPQDAASWVPDADPPRITIVGLRMDSSLRRVVDYLTSQFDLPINGVFFDVFANATGQQMLVKSAVVDDEQAAQQGKKRGRGGLAHENILERAEQEGCRSFVEPILKAWHDATGRSPRPERRCYWSLAAKMSGRAVIANLWPWTEEQAHAKKAWLEVVATKMADDLGVGKEQLLRALDKHHITHTQYQDGSDVIEVEISSAEQSAAIAEWLRASYATK